MNKSSNEVEVISTLIHRLESGGSVLKKELAEVLSSEQFDYLYSLDPDVCECTNLVDRKYLKRYEIELKKAEYKLSAALRSTFNVRKLEHESDDICHRAAEILEEIVCEFPCLIYSLDRRVVLEEGRIDSINSDFSSSVSEMPRHIDSSSQYTIKRLSKRRYRLMHALDLLKSTRDELLKYGLVSAKEKITCMQRIDKSKRKSRLNTEGWAF